MFKSHEIKEKNNGIDYFFFRFVFREEKWHSIATAILTFVALNANSGGKCMRILLLWVCMAKVIYPKCYEKSNESCRFLFLGSSGHFGQHRKFCQMLLLRGFLFVFMGKKITASVHYSVCTKKLINTKLRKRALLQFWL